MEIAFQTKEMAEQRYYIARQKYSLGSISFTDFNNAQFDKDRAAVEYVSTLRNYWSLYYLFRNLALFDFENIRCIALSDLAF